MAKQKMYIYRVDLGHHAKTESTHYIYAVNAETAKAFCRSQFKPPGVTYDMVHLTKIGETRDRFGCDAHLLTEEEEAALLKSNIGGKHEKFSERSADTQ